MRDTIILQGVVLRSQPIGEYDKRLVILTRERGRITAFARGARRAKSSLIAAANPFVFAQFSLFEGRDSYTLYSAEVKDYFTDLAPRMPAVFYGYYVLELAEYYGRDGLPAAEEVDLVYVTLRALMKEAVRPELIRRVYEIRMMAQNGDYAVPNEDAVGNKACHYALRYAAAAPLSKLYSFSLDEETEAYFLKETQKAFKNTIDRPMRTLEVLEEMRAL